jgi:hypothetical protein
LDTKATTDAPLLHDDVAQAIEQDNEPVVDGVEVDEAPVNEEEEEDYGYVREDSESETESEAEQVGRPDGEDDFSDQDLGPEDDAGAVDMLDECGYADL